MPEINFLILEKTFENFLRRCFRCLKEKENEIFEENVTNNCLRKNFYQKDGRHYQSVMNGPMSHMITYGYKQFWYWSVTVVTIYLTIHKWPWQSWSQNKMPTLIRSSSSPCCYHLHVSAAGNNAKMFNRLVLCMLTAQKIHNFLCRGHKTFHLRFLASQYKEYSIILIVLSTNLLDKWHKFPSVLFCEAYLVTIKCLKITDNVSSVFSMN